MDLILHNSQTRYPTSRHYFVKNLTKALKILNIKGQGEIGLHFVSPQKMAALNSRYMHKRGATDVLSFPVSLNPFLGDIFICPAVAARQAKKLNHSLPQQMMFLVFHGLLHLTGYDHHTLSAKKKMVAAEKKLIAKVLHITDYSLLADTRL
ncbi:rRNA maturation RNase YbeY [bacterium]|nr:rRNA maturation RNase YbeY [bacterium]